MCLDELFDLFIFLGVPLGCVWGLYQTNKNDKSFKKNWRILAAFSMSFTGICLVILLTEKYWPYMEAILIFLIPLAALIFGATGYYLPNLFNNIFRSQTSSGIENLNIKKVNRFFDKILPIGMLLILISTIFYMRVSWLPSREHKREIVFVKKLITSIINGNDFYKIHSDAEIINEIEKHKSKISNNYDLYEKMPRIGQSYYYLIFDKNNKFQLLISGGIFNELTLHSLSYDNDSNYIVLPGYLPVK